MTNKTAATRYARALLDVAVQQRDDLDAIERALTAFVELLTQHPALARVLLNPAVPVPRKRAAVSELTARADTPATLAKLLVLLAGRDRLVLLPDLLVSYRDRLLVHRNVVRAEVTTAAPLASERVRAIEASLVRMTGRTVLLETRIDPAIIGGVVARIGSTVYDGSIIRQLQKMKDQLVESA